MLIKKKKNNNNNNNKKIIKYKLKNNKLLELKNFKRYNKFNHRKQIAVLRMIQILTNNKK